MFTGLEPEKKKKKVHVAHRNKLKKNTVLHLVLFVKMENIIPNKIYLTAGI